MATVFGKNILENLTIAMYSDRRVMFREYIQNACDSIDAAVKSGLISIEDARIDISIDKDSNRISISDNGIGIASNDFNRVLSEIANSDKNRSDDKGFRGIGRLCGLAYCDELIFISNTIGESISNHMIWDARAMRDMLNDNQKRTADQVLADIVRVDRSSAEISTHGFTVILNGITKESEDLLDHHDIREYLSFEVPVPYDSAFLFYQQILNFAKDRNLSIDEYPIYVNGQQIFKCYNSRLYDNKRCYDEIKTVVFEEFRNDNEELIAWMWYGISTFDGQIKSENIQRGLRLRKNNIQIGSSHVLSEQKLFPEPRANDYFIGEVFAVSPDLIPNARRDYFNENSTRIEFEKIARQKFKILWKYCHKASEFRSASKAIVEFKNINEEYLEKQETGFSSESERKDLEEKLKVKKEAAEKAQKKLDKPALEPSKGSAKEVAITGKLKEYVIKAETDKSTMASILLVNAQQITGASNEPIDHKPLYITDSLAEYTRETRKVVSRIYDIINQNAPDIAADLIAKIQSALMTKKK